MGTRNLTVVYMDGEYRVAQYGQWDGYPEGQGLVCLRFLENDFVEHKFRTNLRKLKMVETDEERKALDILYKDKWPNEFSRDTGAKILKMIQDGNVESGFLINNISFASQGDCEWAWVLDLDKRTFGGYEGWNKTPLTQNDRFFFLGNYQDGDYCGVKLVQSWDLDDLPTEDEFLEAFNKDEEFEDDE